MAVILAHAGCYDGMGAAWAVKKSIATRPGETPDVYHFVTHGQPMPEIQDGEEVIIVDFSYPEDQLRALAKRSFFVSIYDHHKTAQADLQNLISNPTDNMEIVFDMNRSGAMIAWDEFVGTPAPCFVEYLQDRDLWTKKLKYHEEVTAYIQSFERTFQNFDMLEFVLATDAGLDDARNEGAAILRFKTQKVNEICEHAVMLPKLGDYENIPAVNCPYVFASDVGSRLLELHPEAPLSAYWFYRKDSVWQWGLRSRQGTDVDVSAVAKLYGGGGHKHAAGFQGDID